MSNFGRCAGCGELAELGDDGVCAFCSDDFYEYDKVVEINRDDIDCNELDYLFEDDNDMGDGD